ncbi:MAG: hypothetical protein HC890_14850 [Chloroflexaceae bacterium]|nr:hypothetical protein [Chloroflexaceae bacterium]
MGAVVDGGIRNDFLLGSTEERLMEGEAGREEEGKRSPPGSLSNRRSPVMQLAA